MNFVSDIEEKKLGLSLIMEHNTGKQKWNFDEKMVDVFKWLLVVVFPKGFEG